MSDDRKANHASNRIQFTLRNMENLYDSGQRAGLEGVNWVARKGRRIAVLEQSVYPLIRTYLDEWMERVDTAITDAQLPKEGGEVYWFIALAGNLLWAATCFVPVGGPLRLAISGAAIAGGRTLEIGLSAAASIEASTTAQRVIQVMSVVGATVGSGTVEQVFKNPEQDGKRALRKAIANKRGDLEGLFLPRYHQWSSEIDELAQRGRVDIKALTDAYVWVKMFPRIPYDKRRFDTIYKLALNRVNRALVDFNAQWELWNIRKERCQPQYKHRKMYGEEWDYSLPDPGPFQPKLKFDDLTQ